MCVYACVFCTNSKLLNVYSMCCQNADIGKASVQVNLHKLELPPHGCMPLPTSCIYIQSAQTYTTYVAKNKSKKLSTISLSVFVSESDILTILKCMTPVNNF